MREYHFCKSRWSSVRRVPRPRFWRAGVLVWDAKGVKALLRSGTTPLCHVQLLPAAVVARDRAGTKFVREGTRQSTAGVPIPPCGICGHAKSCASVDQRAEERHARNGVANAEAARLSQDAEESVSDAESATATQVAEVYGCSAAILAAAVL